MLRPKHGAHRSRGHAVRQIAGRDAAQFRWIVLHHQTEKYTLRLFQQIGFPNVLVVVVLLFGDLYRLKHLAHHGTLG
jgi:hypothetical protein